jgi:hypothetical protein
MRATNAAIAAVAVFLNITTGVVATVFGTEIASIDNPGKIEVSAMTVLTAPFFSLPHCAIIRVWWSEVKSCRRSKYAPGSCFWQLHHCSEEVDRASSLTKEVSLHQNTTP